MQCGQEESRAAQASAEAVRNTVQQSATRRACRAAVLSRVATAAGPHHVVRTTLWLHGWRRHRLSKQCQSQEVIRDADDFDSVQQSISSMTNRYFLCLFAGTDNNTLPPALEGEPTDASH